MHCIFIMAAPELCHDVEGTDQEKMEYGIRHLEFALEFYRIQMRNGLYFLHEHPAYATSWSHAGMRELINHDDVYEVVGDMCHFDVVERSKVSSINRVPKIVHENA